MADSVFPLRCVVQQYAWGKIGEASEVAQLLASSGDFGDIAHDQPYAELWMGTHPKGEAQIADDRIRPSKLSHWIVDNAQCLGERVQARFGDKLPFLFKVLSVNQSLSIQAHPNKENAAYLHAHHPEHYPDANHKPEMAIALTSFLGLCGFRPLCEILDFLDGVPELKTVVGPEAATALHKSVGDEEQVANALKDCFSNVMMCEKALFQRQLTELVARVEQEVASGGDVSRSNGHLLLKLHKQFPGDVGCFVIYFLNVLQLQPGDAMFLGANEPHAYLYGDCIECMACSDNTVRAGLTSKFIDVPTLCTMLNYTPAPPESKVFCSRFDPDDPFAKIYDPPVPDFTVICLEIPAGTLAYTIAAVNSASIVITIRGVAVGIAEGRPPLEFKRGKVMFISAGKSVTLSIQPKTDMLMFRACCLL
uniref:mannose-6-phosphate isomerase isoform X2 n=1 Tax=Myxine glutinosa TaxID=7769 RepID=UPI00358F1A9F